MEPTERLLNLCAADECDEDAIEALVRFTDADINAQTAVWCCLVCVWDVLGEREEEGA